MLRRLVWLALAVVVAASAQKYDGPVPPKPDLPYLKHGDTLIPTEAVEAKEEKKKDDTNYKLQPKNLQLYKFESKNGHRELGFTAKKPPTAIRIVVTKLSSDGVWKVEVDESLEPGEYSLSPSDSNQAFCFQVF